MVDPPRGMNRFGRDAVGSLACSALAWLAVLVLYTLRPAALVWALDLVAFGFAVAALILAVASLVADRRSAVGWLALAGSIAFPIWLVVLVQGLSGDAF